MRRDGKHVDAGDPESRRSPGRRNGGGARQNGFVERATAKSHSGDGSESVRPHLRDQLKLKALLHPPFNPGEAAPNTAGTRGKDDHHQ